MKDEDDITFDFFRFDEVVNAIKGLNETIKETILVQKVLRYIMLHFDAKVLAIE